MVPDPLTHRPSSLFFSRFSLLSLACPQQLHQHWKGQMAAFCAPEGFPGPGVPHLGNRPRVFGGPGVAPLYTNYP